MPVIDRNVRLFSLADLDKGVKFFLFCIKTCLTCSALENFAKDTQ